MSKRNLAAAALSMCVFLGAAGAAQADVGLTPDQLNALNEKPALARRPPRVGVLPLFYGVVRSSSQHHLQLIDSRAVDLDDATVISPAGSRIRAGMRIAVRGAFEPNHDITKPTILAVEIVIIPADSLGP